MRTISPQQLTAALGLGDESIRLWLRPLNEAAALASVNTPQRWALWLAITSYESSNYTALAESLNYTPEALRRQWRVYRTDEGAVLAGLHGRSGRKPADQKAIACLVYNGRMGNRQGSMDGWEYRGSGIGQITGRDMFAAAGAHLEMDLVGNPDMVRSDRRTAALSAVYPWLSKGMNAHADKGDVAAATKAWTGGSDPETTGLAQRQTRYVRAEGAL